MRVTQAHYPASTPSKRMQGRMIEVQILIALGLVGIVWLTSVSPRIGLAVAAVAAVTVIVFFTRAWIEARGLRRQSRRRLEQAAAEHGLELGLRQKGRVEMYGGVLGLDQARRKLVFASPTVALVVDFDQIRSVGVGVARALGQSEPSWYSIDMNVAGQQESFSVSTTSARQARKWLKQLGEVLGEDLVRDARATLD